MGKTQTPEQKAAAATAKAAKAAESKNKPVANKPAKVADKPAEKAPEPPAETLLGRSPEAPDLDTPPSEQTPSQIAHVQAFNKYVELYGVMPLESLSTEELVKLNQEKEDANAEANKKPAEKATEIVEPDEFDNHSTKHGGTNDSDLENGPSASLESILSEVYAGKKIKLKEEKGVHFIFDDGRLKKYDDKSGSFLESAPLFSYQNKEGWSVAK